MLQNVFNVELASILDLASICDVYNAEPTPHNQRRILCGRFHFSLRLEDISHTDLLNDTNAIDFLY